MRPLPILAVVVVSAWMSPTAASAYTFGDWASDQGYNPGDVLSYEVYAVQSLIGSLNGIGDYEWGQTNYFSLWDNQLLSIESGDFDGLTNLKFLDLGFTQVSSIESGAFSGLSELTLLSLPVNFYRP